MSLETKPFYDFGDFRLDTAEKVLSRAGSFIPVTPKVFETLLVFVENAGRLIEKDELMQKIWQDRFVEESNLTFNIKMLRRALGDSASEPQFIETVPRRGYRFIADVRETFPNGYSGNERQSNKNDLKSTEMDFSVVDYANKDSAVKIPPGSNNISSLRSRPIIYTVAAIIIGVFVLSGFYILKNRASFLSRLNRNSEFLTVEKLTNTGDANGICISPDGKLLAYFTVEGGKNTIWLRQFATGKSIPIISAADEHLYGLAFSRDGEHLFYSHQHKDEPVLLSRVSILGGTPAQILSGFHGSYSFSPDDRQIVFTQIDEAGSALMVSDADGGSSPQKIYLSPRPRFINSVAWSPDGKSIAFIVGNGKYDGGGSSDSSLLEFNLEDKTERVLSDFKWNYLGTLLWLPDQSGILVSGREKPENTDQIWEVSIPGGKATRITEDSYSIKLRGATADFGKIIASQTYLNSSVWIAPKENPSAAKPIAKAQWDVVWTPTGKIIFPARDTIKTDIWQMNVDGGDKKQLTSNDSLKRSPNVSSDGRFIVYVSNQSGRQNIWRTDADGGNPEQLTNGDGENYPSFTPDGRFVVFNPIQDGSLWQVPVEGGEAVQIFQEKTPRISFSPDGTRFAYYGRSGDKRQLLVKSFPEGKLLNEFDAAVSTANVKVVWSKDGKSLIYDNTDISNVSNLWQQSLDGGEPQKLTNFTTDRIFDFSFSPDDSQLAIVRGSWNDDAVLLKGF